MTCQPRWYSGDTDAAASTVPRRVGPRNRHRRGQRGPGRSLRPDPDLLGVPRSACHRAVVLAAVAARLPAKTSRCPRSSAESAPISTAQRDRAARCSSSTASRERVGVSLTWRGSPICSGARACSSWCPSSRGWRRSGSPGARSTRCARRSTYTLSLNESAGIAGFSFGAGPALLAAADVPGLRVVGSFGGYADLTHVIAYVTTGAHDFDGRRYVQRQEEYNRWKLLALLVGFVQDRGRPPAAG